MIDYYSLRFQIEFNFREAKQYWGLQGFMNVNKTPINNAANLSMFMVNVSAKLMEKYRCQNPEYSVFRPQIALKRSEICIRNIKNTSAKT